MTDVLTIQQLVEGFQREILSQERQALQRLVSAYERTYRQLAREQDALIELMQAKRDAGETITAAMVRKDKRYRELIEQTQAEMDKYAAILEDVVRGGQDSAFMLGLTHSEQSIQYGLSRLPEPYRSQITGTLNRMPSEAVKAMVAALQEDSPLWSETLASFGADAAQGVADALLKGLLSGKGPAAIARELTTAWGIPLTRAMTISRTETIRAHRAAVMAGYRSNSHVVKGWTWMSALDNRVCGSCLAMHGTHHPLTETLDDHPNGRCYALADTVTWRDLGIDMDEVEDEPIVAGEEWFKSQPESVQREMMGPGKYQAWVDGKFAFGQLAHSTYDKRWGRTFTEATLEQLLGAE